MWFVFEEYLFGALAVVAVVKTFSNDFLRCIPYLCHGKF